MTAQLINTMPIICYDNIGFEEKELMSDKSDSKKKTMVKVNLLFRAGNFFISAQFSHYMHTSVHLHKFPNTLSNICLVCLNLK